MELTVESAETLLAGDTRTVATENLDGDDERILHQVVVNHSVTDDGRTVVGTRREQRVAGMEAHLYERVGERVVVL